MDLESYYTLVIGYFKMVGDLLNWLWVTPMIGPVTVLQFLIGIMLSQAIVSFAISLYNNDGQVGSTVKRRYGIKNKKGGTGG